MVKSRIRHNIFFCVPDNLLSMPSGLCTEQALEGNSVTKKKPAEEFGLGPEGRRFESYLPDHIFCGLQPILPRAENRQKTAVFHPNTAYSGHIYVTMIPLAERKSHDR